MTNNRVLVNGTVVALDAEHRQYTAVVRAGQFRLILCGDTYTFVGRTSQWNDGSPCPKVGPVAIGALPVSAPPNNSVTIVCPMR